jgi:signal transduction histidine kinase
MKRLFERPFRWRDQKLGVKLGLGFGVLILVFSILGIMVLINMRDIQKQSRIMGEDYIPMVATTYNMEHFTHEAMHAMLGYSLSEEDHYYHTARDHIKRIEQYYRLVDSMIHASVPLEKFSESGSRIGQRILEFKQHTEEMAMLNETIRALKGNMDKTYERFAYYCHHLLIRNNQIFREELVDKDSEVEDLVALHRISKMVNLIIDKGNISRIEALKAMSQKNSRLIEEVNKRHYQYMFTLVNEMHELADPGSKRLLDSITYTVREYQSDLLKLAGLIDQARRLEIRIEESAFAALYESHIISAEINKTTGQTAEETIGRLDASTSFLIGGLILSFLIAFFFSIITTRSITFPLKKSVVFARSVSSGDLNATVDIDQKDEVGLLAETLKEMLRKLKENISILQKTERRMLNIMIETEQKERKRFAEDLHDSLGPLLSTIKLYLSSIKSRRGDKEQGTLMLKNANEVIDEAIQNVKVIANNLMPRLLDDFGLEVALKSFFEHVSHANAIKIDFECRKQLRRLDPKVESMIYNTILELTNNTIKHARASGISLNMEQNHDICLFEYTDDGVGCDLHEVLESKPYSLGIKNIMSRIQSINGRIEFKSEKNKGFQVLIEV